MLPTIAIRRPLSKVQFLIQDESPHYSPGDVIEGHVLFTPQSKIHPTQLALSFEGKTELHIDRSQNNIALSQALATHTFLRMFQPLDSLPLCESEMLRIGTEYKISFKFIVPSELPHHVCNHHRYHEQLYYEHTQIPSTVSHKSMDSRNRNPARDIMAPETASIGYRIQLKVRKRTAEEPTSVIACWEYPVYIRSICIERAPLFISGDSRFYHMCHGTYITRGLCRRPVGHLFMWAEQPEPVPFSMLGTRIKMHIHCKIPYGQSLPDISHTDLRLQAFTAYSPIPWSDFPDMTDPSTWDLHRELHAHTLSLGSHRFLGSLRWAMLPSGKKSELDSTLGVCETYETTVCIPVQLPLSALAVPSFHSCHVSRFYSLKLGMSYRVGPRRRPSKISLAVPVQIL